MVSLVWAPLVPMNTLRKDGAGALQGGRKEIEKALRGAGVTESAVHILGQIVEAHSGRGLDVSLFLAGSTNGRKHHSAVVSDIDMVAIGNGTRRLDLGVLNAICSATREAIAKLGEEGVFVVGFPTFRAETPIEDLARYTIAHRQGKNPDNIEVKLLHTLFYSSIDALRAFEPISLAESLIMTSISIMGEDKKDALLSALRDGTVPVKSYIIDAETTLAYSYMGIMSNVHLPEETGRKEALRKVQYALLQAAKGFLTQRNVTVYSFEDIVTNAGQLPRISRGVVMDINSAKNSAGLLSMESAVALHTMGARAICEIEKEAV